MSEVPDILQGCPFACHKKGRVSGDDPGYHENDQGDSDHDEKQKKESSEDVIDQFHLSPSSFD
jgi:hypothetical protein